MDVCNKTVILRCDFNVPIKEGKILSIQKLLGALATIEYLVKHQAKVVIMSHLSRVMEGSVLSLEKVSLRLQELLKGPEVHFCPATSGARLKTAVEALNSGQVLLMENTRAEDLNGNKESGCDEKLAEEWAGLGDIFIDDAFGVTHRQHASNCGIFNQMAPDARGIGYLVQEEMRQLKQLVMPEAPFVVVMGGIKADDKINQIKALLEASVDTVLVGGSIAATFLVAQGFEVGKLTHSKMAIDAASELLSKYPGKIILPTDVTVLTEAGKVLVVRADRVKPTANILDIGGETADRYARIIAMAKTGLINGTMGAYLRKYQGCRPFADGTEKILQACAQNGNFILGGGNAEASGAYYGLSPYFKYVSTGGGAMISFIASGGELLCQRPLNNGVNLEF